MSSLSSHTSGSPFLHLVSMPGCTAGDEVGGQPSWCVQRGGGGGVCHPHTGSSPLRCPYRLLVQHTSPFTEVNQARTTVGGSSFSRINFPAICILFFHRSSLLLGQYQAICIIFSCLAKLVGINIARVSDSIPTGAPPAQNVLAHVFKGSTKWPIFI